jgi:hypothetical protein
VLLAITLPHRYVAGHWTVTWVGFDITLLGCLALTAWLAWRRRAPVPLPTSPRLSTGMAIKPIPRLPSKTTAKRSEPDDLNAAAWTAGSRHYRADSALYG